MSNPTASLHPGAVQALQRLQRHPGDIPIAAETARVLMRLQHFDLAAQIWQQLAAALPNSLEAPICFAACLISLGQIDAGRELAERFAPLLSALSPQGRAQLATAADCVYPLAGQQFKLGNRRAAETILDLLLRYEPYGRRLLGIDPPRTAQENAPDRLDDHAVSTFIRARIADVAAGTIVPTARGSHSRRHYETAFEPFRGKRTLIVHREHYWPGRHGALHPAAGYLVDGAAEVGLEPRLVVSDAVIGDASGEAADPGGFQRILDAVDQWRPDIVVYENLGAVPVMLAAMAEARARHGFKLIGLQHDIWVEALAASARRAAAVSDAIWHFDPSDSIDAGATVGNIVGSVPPVPRGPFISARNASPMPPRSDMSFIGSIMHSNYLRSVWLIEATRRGIPITLETGFPFVDERHATQEGFARFLADAKTSLCITGRTTLRDAVPGRVWEGILAGAVTIEDGGRKIRHFLAPFAHYIPVSTIDELEFYVGFFARNEDVRRELADSAFSFVTDYYPVVRGWYAPLAVAYGLDAPATGDVPAHCAAIG